MKILHGTVEIAGQMGLLAGALKRKGHVVTAYNTFHSYLDYQDHLINTSKEKLHDCYSFSKDLFDIYHFHYCYSFRSDYSDLWELKAKGKKIIMHHWGDDVRQLRWARQYNPYVNTHGSLSDEVIHQRLQMIAPYVDAAIVQDAEVLSHVTPFYAKTYVLPIAIDVTRFPYSPKPPSARPLIVHAPTNPIFKGTDIIERVLESLRDEFQFDYVRVTGMSNEEAVAAYRQADLVIDQILCGSHGLFACEAMAMGKPVISYIREDLKSTFRDDLPIISANPDTLQAVLRDLLSDPDKMAEYGSRGRSYVEQVHGVHQAAEQLATIYESIV